MTLLIIFLFALVSATGIYLFVQRYFDNRDAGEIHDRLLDRAATVVTNGQTEPGNGAALFESEAQAKTVGARVLGWFNVDTRLQRMAEQAGVGWAPGQIVLGCLGLAFVAFQSLLVYVATGDLLRRVRGGLWRCIDAIALFAPCSSQANLRL